MELPDKPIAIGRTAEIYAWGEGKILKLYLPTIPLDWFESELDICQYTQSTGLPVPTFYEHIQIDGREGIVYERIVGPSMLEEIGQKPWKMVSYARLLARLQAQVHAVKAPPDLETQRQWIRGGILTTPWLPEDLRPQVIRLLDSLPDGDRLCHGDFHPGNILITRRGAVIIDWMTTSRGTATGDVARTLTILENGKPPPGTPARWLLEYLRRQFLAIYRSTYVELCPQVKEELPGWQAVMAANFLDVSLPEEREGLVQSIRLSPAGGTPPARR